MNSQKFHKKLWRKSRNCVIICVGQNYIAIKKPFHTVPSHNELATIDLHIGASHHQNAEGWIRSLGFEYIAANNCEDFKTKLNQFVALQDKPVVFEVFTDLETDGQTVLATYRDLEKQLGDIK